MSRYIPEILRNAVIKRADSRCEYCLIPQIKPLPKHQIEHILAIQHGGTNVPENLALACIVCNSYKGPNIASLDFESGLITSLFNPRTQVWTEHFQFSGAEIIPLSAEARVTVRLLRFNEAERIEERQALIEAGIY